MQALCSTISANPTGLQGDPAQGPGTGVKEPPKDSNSQPLGHSLPPEALGIEEQRRATSYHALSEFLVQNP